jgi:hypothetical protein
VNFLHSRQGYTSEATNDLTTIVANTPVLGAGHFDEAKTRLRHAIETDKKIRRLALDDEDLRPFVGLDRPVLSSLAAVAVTFATPESDLADDSGCTRSGPYRKRVN